MLDQELLAKAEANDVQAIFEVAKAYYIGDGVEENNEKAFELFSKVVALDPNFPDVYSRIGRCYEKGWGTAQDLKKAVDAYTTGANLNSAGCHYYLALAYENGTGVVQDEQKAIQHYKIAADLGDTDSMVEMGHRYRAGNGVEKDDVIATEYYRKAAEKDDSNGVYQLARAYYDGLGVEKDVPRSTQLWEKSAELGHWGAQFYTGINYLTGDGVEKDAKKAAFWFEKAAEQEHPDATYKLGALYLDGVGVERDPTKGIAYIIQAANLGASDAYFLAGVTYFQGNYGYPVDKAKAIEYWTKGSEAGEGGCTKNLGIVYKTGDGAERDPAKALAYFEKAAEQGNIDALEQLGLAYVGGGISGTHAEEKALEYFERAYKAGSADGAYFLGLLLETGEQVEHDLARAYSVYLFAAERGNSDAMIKLGYFLHEGEGVEKDVAKAIEWLEKAKAAGNPKAEKYLSISYRNGEGDPKTAFEHYLKLAEQGDAEAQYQVYNAYENGNGVEKNEALANEWCKKAADNGHIIAAALVGFHEMIFGKETEAVKYWEVAAKGGHLKAATDLANLYLEGSDDVPVNKARAIELLNDAANAGFAEAQNSLGICYMTGNGVPENPAEAVKWFEKAAVQDEEFGMKNLAVCLRNGNGVVTDKAKAAEWFERAAAKGNIQSKSCLADMYTEGEGVLVNYQKAEALYKDIIASKDDTYYDGAIFGLAFLYSAKTNDHYRAFPLWQEAAQRGSDTAQYNLGLCYHNGWGTTKDDDQALYWWRKAAAQGHHDAQHNIDVLMNERNSYGNSNYQSSSQNSQPAKSGGCYVATAVYGSYDCPQVWTLRRFRDYKLATTWYGRLFIRAYYAVSPTVVKLFGKTEWFNHFWKARLDKMVATLQEQGYEDIPYND